MQARYYDPVIGRLLSNDPVGFAEGGTAYFNRYAYTANDPMDAIDTDGLEEQLLTYVNLGGLEASEWTEQQFVDKGVKNAACTGGPVGRRPNARE